MWPNEESSSDDNESVSNDNMISIDINNGSTRIFENEYNDGKSLSSNSTSEPESIKTVRTWRKTHGPLKYSKYAILLFSLLTSQCMNNSNF